MCWRDELSDYDRQSLFEQDLRRAQQRRERREAAQRAAELARELSTSYAGASDCDVSLKMDAATASDFPTSADSRAAHDENNH